MHETGATLRRLGHALRGRLQLQKHHMVFKAEREVWICYPMVQHAEAAGRTLRLACKDFMIVALEFDNDETCAAVAEELRSRRAVAALDELYAFVYSPAAPETLANGWALYDAHTEYARMGALDGAWRLAEANVAYKLCATYPAALVVPKTISDNVLFYAAKFRSKGRVPVLSYYLKLNQCTITRCSQPLVGLKQARSMQDEAVLAAIFATTEDPSGVHGKQTDHLVVDLRAATSAIAQHALGGGSEIMDRYKPARKAYMGVDNLHVVRDSLQRVLDSLRHSDLGAEPPNPSSLDRSQWLKHVALLLQASARVVEHVYFKCSHVVVHCSDGWDRTPQVTSLAMLCLDPYYRTLEGFAVLVEKEWVSFGHQFATRSRLVRRVRPTPDPDALLTNVTAFFYESARGRDDGPIFQQFLDCCYQLLTLFPTAFEFNERFLRRLLYHVYACQYGTFLANCEREIAEHELRTRTRSVWDYFTARRTQFTSDQYVPTSDVLVLPQGWAPRWWAGAFGRADADMNDRDAWRRRAVRPPSTARAEVQPARSPDAAPRMDPRLETKLDAKVTPVVVQVEEPRKDDEKRPVTVP